MSATEAPVHYGRRIIDVEDDDGIRRFRYRWGEEPDSVDFGRQLIVPVGREVLEDRWEGAVYRGLDASKLQARLDDVLLELSAKLTRRDRHSSDVVIIDGKVEDVDHVMDIDGLEKVIREWLIERAKVVAL